VAECVQIEHGKYTVAVVEDDSEMDYAGATVQIKCGVSIKEGYYKEKFESSKRRTTLKMLINIFKSF